MAKWLHAWFTDEEGQGLVEYGLILGLVSVICVAALTTLGGKASATLNTTSNLLP